MLELKRDPERFGEQEDGAAWRGQKVQIQLHPVKCEAVAAVHRLLSYRAPPLFAVGGFPEL